MRRRSFLRLAGLSVPLVTAGCATRRQRPAAARELAADVAGDRVRAVTLHDQPENRRVTLTAPYFVDATELGGKLPPSTGW